LADDQEEMAVLDYSEYDTEYKKKDRAQIDQERVLKFGVGYRGYVLIIL
jgi:hypothetical protein